MPIGIAPNILTLAAGTEIRIPGDAEWEAGIVTNLFSYVSLSGDGSLASQVKVTGLADAKESDSCFIHKDFHLKKNRINASMASDPYGCIPSSFRNVKVRS